MAVIDAQYRTLTCDVCKKTVTYEHPKELAATVEASPWLKTLRFVQTSDNRTFLYCSDLCNVEAVGTGVLNLKEQPKVAIPQGGAQAQIAAAAAAAARQAEANKALKEGSPITLK